MGEQGMPDQADVYPRKTSALDGPVDSRLARSLITGGVVLSSAAAALGMSAPAQANTYTVTNTNDNGPGSLRQALYYANANPGADTVTFNASLNGQTISLYSQVKITDSVMVTGPGAANLTVSVASGYYSRIFYVYGQANTVNNVTISGLTLSHGNLYGNGGAILSNFYGSGGGNLTVQNCTIENNSALYGGGGGFGGGIAAFGAASGGLVTLTSDTIQNNYAKYGGGGVDTYTHNGSVSVTGGTITGNTAYYKGGGGLYAQGNGANVTLSGVTVSNNTSHNGGGGARLKPSGGTVLVENSTIDGNRCTNDWGGGLYLRSGVGSASVTGSQITNNYASTAGGGIEVYETADFTITDSNVTGNTTAGEGGGLYVDSAPITMLHTTVSGNTSSRFGGGMVISDGYYAGNTASTIGYSTFSGNTSLYSDGGGIQINGGTTIFSIALTDITIANNTAPLGSGGGLFANTIASVGITLASSTVAGNSANLAGGVDNIASTFSVSNSIVGTNSAATDPDAAGAFTANYSLFKDATGASLIGSGNITGQDPLLGALANNGGATQTMVPGVGSPVIDAGDPAFTPPPTTDQRGAGYARVVGGRVDMGAIEFGAGPTAAVTPSPALGTPARGLLAGLLALLAWFGLRRRRGSGSALLLLGALLLAQAPIARATQPHPARTPNHTAVFAAGAIASIQTNAGVATVTLADGTALSAPQTRARVADERRPRAPGKHVKANLTTLAQGQFAVLVQSTGKKGQGLHVFLYSTAEQAQAALLRKQGMYNATRKH
jgi:hypothetical protein